MTIKELRIKEGLTQRECAQIVGIPLRTYIRYESEGNRVNTVKYKYILKTLQEHFSVSESSGVLTIDAIQSICTEVFSNYKVERCYLFGSYAKGKATPLSDVDLLLYTPLNSLVFFEIVELLREKLGKKVDVIHQSQLNNNITLATEILKDGIKIYG